MKFSTVRDGLSTSFGLVSVVSWVVAEIPQIMTNYKEKSTEGLSIAFLTTWMIGDIFNIVGCLMEPATLPTQFYMALAYTVATTVLYVQSIYYSHIYPRLNKNKKTLEEPLLATPPWSPSTKSMLCVVSPFLFLGILNFLCSNESGSMALGERDRGFVVRGGRKLLEVTSGNLGVASGEVGMWLGWGMAVIYLGGRIPQIRLNFRRGHVEGLNPLMFFFALLGNLTYVASILVNSIEWCNIAPNLPWLVDSGGCAVLDFIILLQWFYFKDKDRDKKKHDETGEEAV